MEQDIKASEAVARVNYMSSYCAFVRHEKSIVIPPLGFYRLPTTPPTGKLIDVHTAKSMDDVY
jgi:hypothetical protein